MARPFTLDEVDRIQEVLRFAKTRLALTNAAVDPTGDLILDDDARFGIFDTLKEIQKQLDEMELITKACWEHGGPVVAPKSRGTRSEKVA